MGASAAIAVSCQLGGRELPLHFCIFMAPSVLGVQ